VGGGGGGCAGAPAAAHCGGTPEESDAVHQDVATEGVVLPPFRPQRRQLRSAASQEGGHAGRVYLSTPPVDQLCSDRTHGGHCRLLRVVGWPKRGARAVALDPLRRV